jgi:hypothetical protein
MSNLLDLKRKSIALGLCDRYKGMWDSAVSKKELMAIAMDSNGISYIADGCAFGWGLTQEYIEKEFGDYINGYVVNLDGYTSSLWVGAKETLKEPKSTLSLFFKCDCSITIPKGDICTLYVVNSDIELHCEGKCELYIYGSGNIITGINENVRVNMFEESQWIK